MFQLDRHDCARLAKRYRTPFYLYDLDAAVAHAGRISGGLGGRADLLYSMKANPNRKVLEAFDDHVWGLDVSSGGEIDLAADAGYSLSRMCLAGPGKTDQELRRCVEGGLHAVSVESVTELRRIGAIAAQAGKRAAIALRVNPRETAKAFTVRMGGLASQFGVPEEEADAALGEALADRKNLDVLGIHIFSGTQCLDASAIVDTARQSLDIARRLSEAHRTRFRLVNLGGGFGIPYFAGQEAMDTARLAGSIGAAIEQFAAREPAFRETRFAVELGRYLMGMFGIYVASVVDVKENRGKRFVILDGGMNQCFPVTGNFGQVVKKNYPVRNLSRPDDSGDGGEPGESGGAHGAGLVEQDIVGPLCTPMDTLARGVRLPRAEPGDLIAFLHCGAYSFTASPLLFLGHSTPLEITYRGGDYEIARRRHPASDFS